MPDYYQEIANLGNVPSPVGAKAQAYQLKDMIDQEQLHQLGLSQARQQAQDAQKARSILAQSDYTTPEGALKTAQALGKAGLASESMDFMRLAQNARSAQLQQDDQQLKQLQFVQDVVGPSAVSLKQTLLTKGLPMAQAQYLVTRQQVLKQLSTINPQLAAKINASLPSQLPNDVTRASQILDSEIAASGQARQMLSERQAQQRTDIAQQQANTASKREAAFEQELAQKEKSGQVDQTSVNTVAQMIANGQMPMLTGFVLKTPWGQAVVARVGELKPSYSATTYTSRNSAMRAFTSGPESRSVRYMSVAISHMDTLANLVQALQNGDVKAVNRARNAYKTQTGQAAPSNFEAARDIVANEVVKAVTASGGGVTDREEAQRKVQSANSPAQLLGVIQQVWKPLLAGQLSGLKRQYEQGTGRNDFNRFLSPEARRELEGDTGTAQTVGAQVSGVFPQMITAPPAPALSPSTTSAPITATGPNGQKIVLQNGQWVPYRAQ